MQLQIIITRDIVANVYGMPVFVPHIGHAIRSFGDECKNKDPKNILGQHPEDFELWHVGEYNDDNGTFLLYNADNRKQLAVGANYRE